MEKEEIPSPQMERSGIINIRAGILYNLCINDFEKIYYTVVQDILYMNGDLSRIIEYSYFYFIKQIFDPGESITSKSPKIRLRLQRQNSITKNDILHNEIRDYLEEVKYETVFPKFSTEIIKRFKDLGFTDLEINIMLKSFLDFKDLYSSYGVIVVNNWKFCPNKSGIEFEKIALNNLREIGFKISDSKHSSISIDYNDIVINLNGRPDGIIESSPGNIYAAGTLIEIKFKPPDYRPNQLRDEMQLCAYGLIFNVDVLYVVINNLNHMTCKLYRKDKLQQIWNNKKDIILSNTYNFRKLMDDFATNDDRAKKLISMATQ